MRIDAANRARQRGDYPYLYLQGRSAGGTTKGKANHELRNTRGMCLAQVIDRITKAAEELRTTPTAAELQARGLFRKNLERQFGLPIRRLIQMAGLTPRKGTPAYNRETLMELMVSFCSRHGRDPMATDHRRGLLPSRTTYEKYFGSVRHALELAHQRRAA